MLLILKEMALKGLELIVLGSRRSNMLYYLIHHQGFEKKGNCRKSRWTMAYRMALISDSSVLSEAPVEAAGPLIHAESPSHVCACLLPR